MYEERQTDRQIPKCVNNDFFMTFFSLFFFYQNTAVVNCSKFLCKPYITFFTGKFFVNRLVKTNTENVKMITRLLSWKREREKEREDKVE